tara:strand:- start:418 stop:660 length:243 start_codon:yes stop_codon:yes gene_type:complete
MSKKEELDKLEEEVRLQELKFKKKKIEDEEELRLQELKVKKQQLDKKETKYYYWYIKDFIRSSFWGLIILGILWFLFQTC